MKLEKLMWIVWPAFLVAGLLEMLVFAMIDPQDLHWLGQPITLSRQGIYTISFFVFWGMTMLASAMTALLTLSAAELNQSQGQDQDNDHLQPLQDASAYLNPNKGR